VAAGAAGGGVARVLAGQAVRRAAASATQRANGPAVSCVWEMGMMPARLTSPTVGLMPTTPQIEPGEVMEPSVSVPTATAQRLGRPRG